MSDVNLLHPGPAQLIAYGLGRLAAAEAAAIKEHLAACKSCRALFEGRDETSVPPEQASSGTIPNPQPAAGPPPAAKLHEAATLATLPPPAPACANVPPALADHPRYHVLELIGTGGMGAVYKAEHRLMNRLVALKVINPSLIANPDAVERFRLEVRAAAQLVHPNIVTAFDAEQVGDVHFLVMEYVQGVSLDHALKRSPQIPVLNACDYVRQAALGLQHAHEKGMAHRDIKPHNLMLAKGRVKILDFGLARFVSGRNTSGLTALGTVMGTPDYIAPEQATDARQADIRADIYSLGCTLYHLLAGRPPFPKGTPIEKVIAHMEQTPPPLPAFRSGLSDELVAVVERMMAKDPADRFQTPIEVVRALLPFIRGGAAPTSNLQPAETVPQAPPKTFRDPAEMVPLASENTAFETPKALPEEDLSDPPEPAQRRMSPRKPAPARHKRPAAKDYAKAIDTVATPARLLMVTGLVVLAIHALAIGYWMYMLASGSKPGEMPIRVAWIVFSVCGVIAGALLCHGAIKLQDLEGLGWVRVAGVLALTPLTGFLGLPAGILCLTVLSGDIVQRAFSRSRDEDGSSLARRPSPLLIQASIGGVLLVSGVGVAYWVDHKAVSDAPRSGPRWDLKRSIGGALKAPKSFAGELGRWEEGVTSAAFSPDATYVLTGAADGVIHVWNTRDGTESKRFTGHTGLVSCLAISSDGQRCISGSSDKTVKVWDLDAATRAGTASDAPVLFLNYTAHTTPVQSVCLSPDGKFAVSASEDGIVHLWEVDTGAEVRSNNFQNPVKSVAFAPDGSVVAIAHNNAATKNITVWLRDGDEDVHPVSDSPIISIAFSPEEPLILFTNEAGRARLLNWQTKSVLPQEMRHSSQAILAGAFLPGRHLITLGADNTVRLWNVNGGDALAKIAPPSELRGLAVAANGAAIAMWGSKGEAYLWQLAD
jgi:serine/threonine protein kinase/WD40 repeat protein